MQRNLTTLFLESPGAVTPVPWFYDAPDFSAFTDPTLSVLQKAWSDFVASGEELEVVADPEPVAIADPDWISFNTAMLSDSNWQSWAIPADLRSAIIAASINNNLVALESAYAIAKATVPPTEQAIAGWQALADLNNIPIVF